MIDHERHLLFIHITRTGGTSIETALVGDDWWRVDPASKHISASQARALYGERIWRSYLKFAVVRNPWDRLVSMWGTGWWCEGTRSRVGAMPSLQDFLGSLRPHPHERYDALAYHQILDESVDAVLRFENLHADFNALLKWAGCRPVELPRVEAQRRGPYWSYFDPPSRDLVAARFSRDIAEYGYQF